MQGPTGSKKTKHWHNGLQTEDSKYRSTPNSILVSRFPDCLWMCKATSWHFFSLCVLHLYASLTVQIYVQDIHLRSTLPAVSAGAVCSLTVVVPLPRRHQPVWPQDHLHGVASHAPLHRGRGFQGRRPVPVGLRGSRQEDLHPRGEILLSAAPVKRRGLSWSWCVCRCFSA